MQTMSLDNLTLSAELAKTLKEVGLCAGDAIEIASEEVAKQAVQKLKQTSPVGSGTWGGHYAQKWRVKVDRGKRIIYNTKYQLTHLLEHGHDVVSHGRAAGHVSGQPHIRPVEEWCQEEFERELSQQIEIQIQKGVD